jgi:putative FmdB family regulatory protein
MPTYDYQCTKCKKIKEKFHGINDTPSYVCCDSAMKKYLGTAPAVHGANTGGRKSNT